MRSSTRFCLALNQQFAGDELAALRRARAGEEFRRRAAVRSDRPRCSSTMSPASRSRLAEIVRRHHHLDAARGDGADDVLDRLGGGRIEARGRLVEEQHLGVARERARQRQPLLLAAGQPPRRAAAEAREPDQREQFGDAAGARGARHAGGGERVADVAGGAAPEHHRALEHDGARPAARRRGRPR